MSRKNINISVTIPLLLIVVGTLLGYLLLKIETVEKFLISYLRYRWSVWVLITSSFLLIILFSYYLFNRATKPLNKKERDKLLKIIKDMVKAQYLLHTRNVLAKRFDELLEREAARGFTLPTGALAGAVSDLYIADIVIYSILLKDALSKAASNINRKSLHPHLVELINEMFVQNLYNIKELYNRFVETYFSNMDQDHINLLKSSFAIQAEKETKLRAKNLSVLNNLDQII